MRTLQNALILLAAMAISTPAVGQKKKTIIVNPGPNKIEKHHARKVIHRTAVVVFHAHKQVKKGKNYTGDLAKAIAHQRYAKKLYSQGKYLRAIHQSRLSRLFAIKAIKANKGKEIEECRFSKEENDLLKDGPSEDELVKELNQENPGAKYKDEDNLISEPDIDLNADE